jgi:hypothetical protein
MPTPTKIPTGTGQEQPGITLPHPNRLTAEQLGEKLAAIRRRRNDPDYLAYLERGREATEEFRRKVEEEYQRQLDEEGK